MHRAVHIDRDPFLIASAIAEADGVVVSAQASRPATARANRRVPDVAHRLGERRIDTIQMTRGLQFETRWRS